MKGKFQPCSKCGGYPNIAVKGENFTAVYPSCKYVTTISHASGFDFNSAFEELGTKNRKRMQKLRKRNLRRTKFMNPFTKQDFLCPICGKYVLNSWLEQDDNDGIYVIQCPECSAKGYGANYPDAYHNMQTQDWILAFSDALEETIGIFRRIVNSLEKHTINIQEAKS